MIIAGVVTIVVFGIGLAMAFMAMERQFNGRMEDMNSRRLANEQRTDYRLDSLERAERLRVVAEKQGICKHCYCRSEPPIDWSIHAFPMQSLGAGNPKCCKCEWVDFTPRAEGKKK